MDLNYNYGLGTNDNGNVLGITNNKNTARNQTFTHETNFAPLNRLLTAQSGSAWGINFTGGIDAWGNPSHTGTISGTSTNPMSVNQSVNGSNQFTLLGYSYDAAGNVLQDGSGSTACAGNAYTWNAEEEMTCALGSSYTYDGDGIRVKKTGGSATPTLYWGTGTLAESDTSGNLTSEYIFLNGRRIARRDVATGSVYYYFADELGSSNVLATSAGALENESDFYPFGGELPVTQNLTNQKYKFEGKERDAESASLAQPQGLDNFGARFDSSAMGRFMSPDWAAKAEPVPYAKMGNPQTLNLYAFTLNNPESAPDMDGHFISFSQYNAPVEVGAGNVQTDLGENDPDPPDPSAPQTTTSAPTTQTGSQSQAPQKAPNPQQVKEGRGFIQANGYDIILVHGHWQPSSTSSDADIASWWKDYNAAYRTALAFGATATGALAIVSGRLPTGPGTGLTPEQFRDLAKYEGMTQVKDTSRFKTGGRPVYEKNGRFFSGDTDNHGPGVWKEFNRKGERIGTVDLNFNKVGD